VKINASAVMPAAESQNPTAIAQQAAD